MLFGAILVGLFVGLFLDSYLTPFFPSGWMGALLGFIVASLVIYILVGLAQHRRNAGLALDYAYEATQKSFSPVLTSPRIAPA